MKRKSIPKQTRQLVFAKYGGKCAYCGCGLNNNFRVDHITPFYNGGLDNLENLNPSCFDCNSWKMTFSIEQFRREMEAQVERARRYSRNFRVAEKFGLVKQQKTEVTFFFESAPKINC